MKYSKLTDHTHTLITGATHSIGGCGIELWLGRKTFRNYQWLRLIISTKIQMCSSVHSKVETRASQINFTFFFSFRFLVTALTKGGSLIDVTSRKENRGMRPGNTIFFIFFSPGLGPLRFFALIGPFQLDCSGVSPLEEPSRIGGRMQKGKWFHWEI